MGKRGNPSRLRKMTADEKKKRAERQERTGHAEKLERKKRGKRIPGDESPPSP